MKQKLSVIIPAFLLISATLCGCTVLKQNPQNSPAQTIQPISAPSQQGALPEVDYSIPNAPMRGASIIVYEDKLLMESYGYKGIISCNLNGKDAKILDSGQKLDTLFSQLSQSNGWIYYELFDGIYKIKPNGDKKTKILDSSMMDADGESYRIGPSMAVGDSLYYAGYDKTTYRNSFYCINADGRKRLFDGISNLPMSFTIYKDIVYFSTRDGAIIRYALATGKIETILDDGFCFSIVNEKLYYFDNENYLCVFDLKTKENVKLLEKIDDYIKYSIQFHNYLLYFTDKGVLGFNINTKKMYDLGPYCTDNNEICATNDGVYMVLDEGLVKKLYFKDGKVNVDPIETLNNSLKNLKS